ncbi:MAG: CBS domain-containing protein [Sphingobacteriales bacterium]|nr:MAG: CBS domain-containing protein [Sphingobacteriales bacterium]
MKYYHRFLLWRIKYISNRHFILIISVITGICGGLAAVIMKSGVHYVQHLLTIGISAHYHSYLFFIYPLIGILLTLMYKSAFKLSHFGHGMSSLLLTISKKGSRVEPQKMHSHIVSAALTVGFGGSVGLESPIVTTGAAIGSNLGQLFHLTYKKRTLLIGCGVAAGIGGIFNAPIAGLIFCMEVLMLELSVPAFVPLLIAGVTGTIISRYFMGSDILFNFSIADDFYNHDIPFYILLGAVTGTFSVFFLRRFIATVEAAHKIKSSFLRAVIGGALLGLMIFIFPPLYGEGYSSIKDILAGQAFTLLNKSVFVSFAGQQTVLLAFVAAIILIKVFASGITIGSGGNGGTFAPSLFVGGLIGFFVSHAINITGFLPYQLSESSFVLVGMAGMLSGVLHAPLTAIFLIAEITNGYILIIPLMLVSAISFFTSSYFEPHSVYLKQLANKGHVHFHDRDKRVLTVLRLKKLVEQDLVSVKPNGTLKDLVDAVSRSQRNIFPVVGDDNKLEGIIQLDDIRHIMFRPEMYEKVKIAELMHAPAAQIVHNESMEEVMKKFDKTGAWNLPVVDKEGIYIGLISKSKIFSQYRNMLKKEAKANTNIIE